MPSEPPTRPTGRDLDLLQRIAAQTNGVFLEVLYEPDLIPAWAFDAVNQMEDDGFVNWVPFGSLRLFCVTPLGRAMARGVQMGDGWRLDQGHPNPITGSMTTDGAADATT